MAQNGSKWIETVDPRFHDGLPELMIHPRFISGLRLLNAAPGQQLLAAKVCEDLHQVAISMRSETEQTQ